MRFPKLRSTTVPALPLALLPLAAALFAAAGPAQAQALYSEARAGSAEYLYNTIQGAFSQQGNASGSVGTGIGNGEAKAFAASEEGDGAFRRVQSVSASADYATAGLHATVITDGFYGDGRARAQLNDTLTFNVAGANAATVTQIGLDLTLTGSISEMQNVNYLYDLKMFANGRAGLTAGWTTVLYDTPTDARNYVGWAVSGGTGSPDGFDSWELLAGTATEKHLHGVFSLTGAQTAFDLIMGLSLSCGGGTDCDFGNSGHLSFVLPDNVTLTSASGLLLTGNNVPTVPAVPEPETYALMLAGLGLTGWFARRRLAPEATARSLP